MLFTIGFVFWRFLEIITLIPIVGMLAYFVNGYVNDNVLTPNYILVLFIVSVLALAWAIFTLFLYHRSSANAKFVALIDLGMTNLLLTPSLALAPLCDPQANHELSPLRLRWRIHCRCLLPPLYSWRRLHQHCPRLYLRHRLWHLRLLQRQWPRS